MTMKSSCQQMPSNDDDVLRDHCRKIKMDHIPTDIPSVLPTDADVLLV